ncbi:hypothetical protein SteCoe_13736 [Stentor coeruleus]|uniref:Uncharacterized protein n=1 Tax=Stentor coeruleus TaxID=5963 RepID=A0A1R2C7N1_9CILI|nr:hypothetical protein SteCoe_13736 [Stentor coeruleus]
MAISLVVIVLSLTFFVSGVFLDFKITSDTSCWIVGPTSTGGYAIIHNTISGWNTNLMDANWIWDINLNTAAGFGVVTKHFYIPGTPNSGTFRIAADNRFTTYLNNLDANCKSTYDTTFSTVDGILCNVKSYLRSGLNVLVVSVENTGGNAGVMFKLEVTSNY